LSSCEYVDFSGRALFLLVCLVTERWNRKKAPYGRENVRRNYLGETGTLLPVVTRIRVGKPENKGSVPGRAVDYVQTRSGAHTAYYSVGTEALDTVVKQSAGA